MATRQVLIYYKSCSARARALADDYQSFFAAQLGVAHVCLVPSDPDREPDIAAMRSWLQQVENVNESECLVIGGDGSINIAAQVFAETPVIISVIPAGTGNDFATALAIKDPLWRRQGTTETSARSIGKIGEYYFINHAGTGISVALQRLQSDFTKRWLGRSSYLLALLRYLFTRPSRRCRIINHDLELEFQVVTVNKAIGGGIVVYPEAQREQQILGYLAVPKLPRLKQLNALYWLLRRQPKRSAIIVAAEADSFTIGDIDNSIELDGDSIPLTGPAEARIVRAGLTVRHPQWCCSQPANSK
ncbi:diacylglycerol/lipid kinase family protein [Pseudidiomarina sp. YC-516-91]|uniref:diacylglycerol/lipid kinase family protein n=1 Tax=Pseudidiomarina salilacus TaxID=3384452 RepID=UPI003984D83C